MLRRKRTLYLLVFCLMLLTVISVPQNIFGIGDQILLSDDELEVVETAAKSPEQGQQPPDLAVAAKAAVLLDAGSGKFLYEQNSHEKLHQPVLPR